jgi:hypothetical protein
MDREGYPEESELELVKNWDYRDIFNLIDFIEDRWAYADSGYFIKRWGRNRWKKVVLFLELHTAGWSGNESIINELLTNRMAMMCLGYRKWETGGHYYFEVNPTAIGYKPVDEMATDLNVSRQYIHKTRDKYDWITAGKRNKLIRPRGESTTSP